MTVHWNSRRGFANESNTTSSADAQAAEQQARVLMAELLWAMRKVPEVRSSYVHRGRKLVSDTGYPPEEVVEAVADLLARKLGQGRLE